MSAPDLAADLPPSARRHAEAVSHNSAPPLVCAAPELVGIAGAALITFLTSATLDAE